MRGASCLRMPRGRSTAAGAERARARRRAGKGLRRTAEACALARGRRRADSGRMDQGATGGAGGEGGRRLCKEAWGRRRGSRRSRRLSRPRAARPTAARGAAHPSRSNRARAVLHEVDALGRHRRSLRAASSLAAREARRRDPRGRVELRAPLHARRNRRSRCGPLRGHDASGRGGARRGEAAPPDRRGSRRNRRLERSGRGSR
jgi:hypothetical protein